MPREERRSTEFPNMMDILPATGILYETVKFESKKPCWKIPCVYIASIVGESECFFLLFELRGKNSS